MKKMKLISILLLMIITIVGVTGCMDRTSSKSNRNENDQEYLELMQNYIQEKYSIKVEVIESIFPKEGFNTALEENILIVRDSNGVIANVKARLATPYKFTDDYMEASTASAIQDEVGLGVRSDDSKIYVVPQNLDITNIDISPSNILALTFVSMINGKPTEADLKSLYDIYSNFHEMGYEKVNFLVGFTDGSVEFEKAVSNYTIYGKSSWEDYSGEVFAKLYVTEKNLSYDEFKEKID